MLPPATVACAVILGDAAEVPDPGTLAGEMVAIGVALLVVNLWEEGAWAGFLQTHLEGLQTHLEGRHGLLTASALTAIPSPLSTCP